MMNILKKLARLFGFRERLLDPAEMSVEEKRAEITRLTERINQLEPLEPGFNKTKSIYLKFGNLANESAKKLLPNQK